MKKLLILLVVFPLFLQAQPLVFLGSSRSAVQKYMSYEIRWMAVKSTADELTFRNPHEKVTVSYRFVKNTLGTARTCIMCTVTLPDSASADSYADERMFSCRFRPEEIGWILNTDLNDLQIKVFRLGNSFIYKY
jgi:hypothetical protein